MKNYTCPKCHGADYFLGIRTVSGFTVTRWNGLKTKQMPICRDCDEIMVSQHENANLVNKIGRVGMYTIFGFVSLVILANIVLSFLN
ncbi:MAG: hypothetical protein EB067_08150 [Actinobacteria bacterium]|nr:hypothetical protein [Actinomycetota bacterium]